MHTLLVPHRVTLITFRIITLATHVHPDWLSVAWMVVIVTSTPIAATAILVAPPESRHKERFRSHLAEIVQVPDDDFSPLGKFIEKIKK